MYSTHNYSDQQPLTQPSGPYGGYDRPGGYPGGYAQGYQGYPPGGAPGGPPGGYGPQQGAQEGYGQQGPGAVTMWTCER